MKEKTEVGRFKEIGEQ